MKCFKFFSIVIFLSVFSSVVFAKINFPKTNLKEVNATAVKTYLLNNILQLSTNESLQLYYEKHTHASQHYTFQLLYKNIAVYNAFIKVNTDNFGNILSIANDIENAELLINASDKFANENLVLQQYNFPKNEVIVSPNYYYTYATFEPIILLRKINANTDSTYFVNNKLQIINAISNAQYLKLDTTIHAKVFNPDPLTTMQKNYGGVYINNHDSNAMWLDSALVNASFNAKFDTDSNQFYLENNFVKIEELDLPTVAPATQNSANFYFNRSQSGFEDCMAMYHLSNYHQHLSTLGYDSLLNLQVKVDSHAENGADNSAFFNGNGSPYILYGTGGVNDAEDADVIIHEYNHGVSWSANNNVAQSFERMGLDEGLADYFATSYSKSISTFRWADMFTWDGHNEFWAGRTASTTNNYPNTSGDMYKIGEIWNCAMMKIWDAVGRNITDKLMLEALHFFTNTTTLPEAAMYVLQSDSVLYNGVHTIAICTAFYQKNIVSGACGNVPVATIVAPNKNIIIENTLGFANNSSNLFVKSNTIDKHIQCHIIDAMGNIVYAKCFTNINSFEIENQHLPAGMYILHLQIDNELKNQKLIVF